MHLPALLPPSDRPRAFAGLRPRDAARGFTLTELLVVIAIIAMLVALTSVAVVTALGFARQTRVKTEVDALDAAMKAFKEKYGAYPPSYVPGGTPAVKQFVATAFPRYDINRLDNDLKATGLDRSNYRPDQALVFWLNGFSNDPQNPFVTIDGYQIINGVVQTSDGTPSGTPIRAARTPLFDFDPSRLAHVGNALTPAVTAPTREYPSYFPQGSPTDDTGAPYVYFASSNYGSLLPDPPSSARLVFNADGPGAATQPIFPDAGVAAPYALDLDHDSIPDMEETWVNPDTFQIIAAGGDNKIGGKLDLAGAKITGKNKARLYPTGAGYDETPEAVEEDNVTNFCESARLGDDRP